MLQLLVLLFHRINISRHMRETGSWDDTNEFQLLNMTSGLPENYQIPNHSPLCFYLDYESSITLTMDGNTYKNPIFYCPDSASDIKFEPVNAEIYYLRIFDLEWSNSWLNSIYITTKDSSIKSPNSKVTSPFNESYYAEIIVTPIPNVTHTASVSGEECWVNDYWNSCSYIVGIKKNSCEVTVKVNPSDYTIKRKIAKRYSISLPTEGPYAFTGNGLSNGLSTGGIVGIVIAVLVVVVVVGFCIFWFVIKGRKLGLGSDANTQ